MTARKDELDRRAARLAVDAVALMNRAFEHSELKQVDLATRLGVGESRVSQILNGDGNVRLATLARVLGALGFRVRIDIQPIDADAPVLARRERQKPRMRQSDGAQEWSSAFTLAAPDSVPAGWTTTKVEVLAHGH